MKKIILILIFISFFAFILCDTPPSDTEPPLILTFLVAEMTTQSTVPITLIGQDNYGITGWMITKSSTPPSADDTNWLLDKPTTYTVSEGLNTLYAWAKDEAGNISNSKNANTFYKQPTIGGSGSWLIMVYLDAANNLEEFAIQDFNEMEYGYQQLSATMKQKVKILVLFDRMSGYDSSNGDWTGTRLYEISSDSSNTTINSTLLTGWWGNTDQEQNMGNVLTLKNFIEYCQTFYQFEKESIVLWNHGDGAKSRGIEIPDFKINRAICWDEDNGDDCLYLNEIQTAIKNKYNSSNKLNLLGMDACLMGTVEVAYEFRDCVEYMAFSPNNEYAGGWNYATLISGITEGMSGSELAQRVVTTFKNSVPGYYTKQTQTAVDLSQIANLRSKINLLAIQLANETQTTVQTTRDNSRRSYNTTGSPDYEDLAFPHYDIGHFCTLINAGSFSANTKTAATDVITALNQVIVYAWGDDDTYANPDDAEYEGADPSRGLTIFFSRGNDTYEGYSHYKYQGWYSSYVLTMGTATVGSIDFCSGSNTNGTVETWKEMLEKFYDPSNTLTTWESF